jgi:hypothetical protein
MLRNTSLETNWITEVILSFGLKTIQLVPQVGLAEVYETNKQHVKSGKHCRRYTV